LKEGRPKRSRLKFDINREREPRAWISFRNSRTCQITKSTGGPKEIVLRRKKKRRCVKKEKKKKVHPPMLQKEKKKKPMKKKEKPRIARGAWLWEGKRKDLKKSLFHPIKRGK